MIRSAIETSFDRWANLVPFVRFMILALLAGVVLLTLRPVYGIFKSWRLDQNLVSAQKALGAGQMSDARDLSLTVLAEGNPRIEALRILEASTASLQDPRHGEVARSLMDHPQSSDDDRWKGFEGTASVVPLGLLGQVWTTLPERCRQTSRFAIIFADRLIAEPRLTEAASVLLAVPEAVRTPELDQRLIRILIRSGKPEGYEEAQRLIAGKWPAAGAGISDWLDLLEEIPVGALQGAMLAGVGKALDKAPSDESVRAALMLARLAYAGDFSRRASLLEEVISRWKESEPVALAKFLRDLGFHQLLLESFPIKAVEGHPKLFPLVLEAMERADEWKRVLQLLDAYGGQIPKFEELAHRAIVAAKTGDATRQGQHWAAAINDAKSGPMATEFLRLHQIARHAGMQEEAEQAMLEAIRLGRGPLPLYSDLKGLLSSLAAQGRENIILEICAIYLSFEGGEPVLLTQYAYLACLNNLVEAKTILKAIEPLAKRLPNELPIQCVLATVYLCAGQPEKAAEVLDPFKLNPVEMAPGYRAAFLVTQVLNQRLPADDPLITEFPWKALQPSERKKFSELIRSCEP